MNDGKKRRSSAELPAHKRFAKSRSRWIYPSFQNTIFVFCEDCGLCALIIRLKLKTEDRANAKQAHHDKAIALQQPHSFSIKDCTSPYSYTFPYCSNNVPCKKKLYSLLTKAKISSTLCFDNTGGELKKGHCGGNYV